MRKTLLLTVISVLALVGLNPGIVAAHTLDTHSADCESVTGSFTNFPSGDNEITVTSVLSVKKSFNGTSGSVSATWAELGVDTGDGLVHTYSFSWVADGGGQAGPFTFDAKDCKEEPPKECPDGQTGTPPNCVEEECPNGQTGTPPNCVTPPEEDGDVLGTQVKVTPVGAVSAGGGGSSSTPSAGSAIGLLASLALFGIGLRRLSKQSI